MGPYYFLIFQDVTELSVDVEFPDSNFTSSLFISGENIAEETR